MGTRSSDDRTGTAGPCDDDGPGADVCQPRVRTGLLVVSESGRACDLALLAAERLRIACVHHERVADAADHLAGARVSCVLLDASGPELEPMSALARLKAARSDVPIVVLGADGNSTLALAAVQAGAQDYLVRDEVDAGSLERSIRYAIDRKRTEVQLAHLAAPRPPHGSPEPVGVRRPPRARAPAASRRAGRRRRAVHRPRRLQAPQRQLRPRRGRRRAARGGGADPGCRPPARHRGAAGR